MPNASSVFSMFFYIAENQYQTESKCHKTLRIFFMDQKEHKGPWLCLGVLRGEHNPPGRARRPRRALVGCAHLGCPRTASLLYKYPNIPDTLGESTKYSSSRRGVQNHQIQSRHHLGWGSWYISNVSIILWRPRFDRTLIIHANVYDQGQGLKEDITTQL